MPLRRTSIGITTGGSRTVSSDLIYDVGLNNGDDTAFYLSRGFRVVAIEADPTLADAARERFRQQIGTGAVTVVNVGIADHDGEAEFWICHINSEWNSFERATASREHSTHHSVTIPVRRFASILNAYGVPHFLKVDIEGYDHLCLEDLGTVSCPLDRGSFRGKIGTNRAPWGMATIEAERLQGRAPASTWPVNSDTRASS